MISKIPLRIISLLLISAAVFFFPVLPAAAADGEAASPGMEFVCEPSEDGTRLTVTANLHNPDDQINAGMFVLDYDTSKLTASADSLTACENIIISEGTTYFDGVKGYIGADWYPATSIEPSPDKTPLAVIVFDVNGSARTDHSLSVCTDTDFLDGIGGYGSDKGVLLCTDSTHTFSAGDGTARVIFTPASYGYTPVGNNNAAGRFLLVLAVIALAAGLCAAAYYFYIKKKRSVKGVSE